MDYCSFRGWRILGLERETKVTLDIVLRFMPSTAFLMVWNGWSENGALRVWDQHCRLVYCAPNFGNGLSREVRVQTQATWVRLFFCRDRRKDGRIYSGDVLGTI